MSKEEKKVNRRDFLFTASYTVGAVGVGAVIWPMIDQMNPDKAQQALATTEVDSKKFKLLVDLWRNFNFLFNHSNSYRNCFSNALRRSCRFSFCECRTYNERCKLWLANKIYS